MQASALPRIPVLVLRLAPHQCCASVHILQESQGRQVCARSWQDVEQCLEVCPLQFSYPSSMPASAAECM